MAKKRILWIDVVRAWGMLFIIWGHTLKVWGSFQGAFFFTVNVPIFFALSGYLYHPQKFIKQIYKLICNLLLPYVFTASVMVIGSILLNHIPHWGALKSMGSGKELVKAAVFGMGGSTPLIGVGTKIIMPEIGAIWFLIALFWASIVFNALMKALDSKKNGFWLVGVITLIVCYVGFWMTPYHNGIKTNGELPWSLNAAMIGFFFLWFGHLLKRVPVLWRSKRIGGMIILVATMIYLLVCYYDRFNHFGMATAFASNWTVSLIGALSGCVVMMLFAYWVEKLVTGTKLIKVLTSLAHYGQASLVVLCFHIMELSLVNPEVFIGHVTHFPAAADTFTNVLYRIIVSLIAIWFVKRVPFLRKVFFNRQNQFKFQSRIKFANS